MKSEPILDLDGFFNGLDPDSFCLEEVKAKQGQHIVENVEIADHFIVDGHRGTVVGWKLNKCEYHATYRYTLDVAWMDRDGNALKNRSLDKRGYHNDVHPASPYDQGFPERQTQSTPEHYWKSRSIDHLPLSHHDTEH